MSGVSGNVYRCRQCVLSGAPFAGYPEPEAFGVYEFESRRRALVCGGGA